MFEIDLNNLLMRKIEENGGGQEYFDKFSDLIKEYARRSGAPEDGVTLTVIDSLSCGMTKDEIETQLKVYHSKVSGADLIEGEQ